jgi:hypothetical protein
MIPKRPMRGSPAGVVHMATVHRNGRPYSYKSVRRDGRVTSEYRGAGEIAELYEVLDEEARLLRQHERDRDRAWREHVDTGESEVASFCGQVDALAAAALQAAGFYRHHRGEWRRRRA